MKEKKGKETKVKANSFGAAGFTLAVSSLSILILGAYGLLLMPVLGLIFSIIQQRKKPTKLGKVGIIVSIISIVLFILYFIWIGPMLAQYLENYSTV